MNWNRFIATEEEFEFEDETGTDQHNHALEPLDEAHFAQIKADLDGLEAKSAQELARVLTKQRNALVGRIKGTGGDWNKALDKLKLEYQPEFQEKVLGMLQNAFKMGGKDAGIEVEAGKKAYAVKDVHQDDDDGIWRTIRGRHVFIRRGQTATQAVEYSKAYDAYRKAQEVYNHSRGYLSGQPEGKKAEKELDAAIDKLRKVMQSMPPWKEAYAQQDYVGLKDAVVVTNRFGKRLTPMAALKYLRQKSVFVTDVTSDRITAEVKNILLQAIKSGESMPGITDRLFKLFDPYIGTKVGAEVVTPWRLETIVRTNTTDAYNQARLQEFLNPKLSRFILGIRFTAILDSRTTVVCRFLDNKVFKPDSSALSALVPPLHHNCRSLITAIMVGMKVDPSEFITSGEVVKARLLADIKFLEQEDDTQEDEGE